MVNIIAEDIAEILGCNLPWESLAGKVVAVTGANGMLAAYVVETLLSLSDMLSTPIRVIALVRNKHKAEERFKRWLNKTNFIIQGWSTFDRDLGLGDCNIMIHAASISRPDSCRPVDVIQPNVVGTWNLLDYCTQHCDRFETFCFFSSRAVYGDDSNVCDVVVKENQCFPIDQLKPESCYAVSKRMGENMCISYMKQYGIPIKILRYAHTYGPGMDLANDPRSFVSFVNKALHGDDIELFSDGEQKRCFCYISDATKAFFYVLLLGAAGEAYNVANENGETSIYNLANMIAQLGGGG